MYTVAVAMLAATVACGGTTRSGRAINIDAQVLPYLNNFLVEATSRRAAISTFNISAEILSDDEFTKVLPEPKNPSTVGLCISNSNHTFGHMYFRKSYWDWAMDEDKRLVVYHEAGHCLLGITYHVQRTLSIMNPFLPSSAAYDLHQEDMLQELFTLPAGDVAP